MADRLSFRKARTGLLITLSSLGIYGGFRAIDGPSPDSQGIVQTVTTLETLASQWANRTIAKGQTDYYSMEDEEYLAQVKEQGTKPHKYYGPYALSLEQLVMSGYVKEKNGRFDWTGKRAGGQPVTTRAEFLALDEQAHLEVFREMMLGSHEKFRREERNDGLLLYTLTSGDEELFYKILTARNNGEDMTQFPAVDNFINAEGFARFDEVETALDKGDLDRAVVSYEMEKLTMARAELDFFPDFSEEFDIGTQRDQLGDEAASIDIEVPERPIELYADQIDEAPGLASFVEGSAKAGGEASSLYEAMMQHMWQCEDPKQGVHEDSRGKRRYTALNFSTNDLKLLGLLEKDKDSGADVWTEQAGVHDLLGISYQQYRSKWREYSDAAREAFVEDAQTRLPELNKQYMQKV